ALLNVWRRNRIACEAAVAYLFIYIYLIYALLGWACWLDSYGASIVSYLQGYQSTYVRTERAGNFLRSAKILAACGSCCFAQHTKQEQGQMHEVQMYSVAILNHWYIVLQYIITMLFEVRDWYSVTSLVCDWPCGKIWIHYMPSDNVDNNESDNDINRE
ncbi:unnamed protein product, partial [Discosporangium mesarthrocarpum]